MYVGRISAFWLFSAQVVQNLFRKGPVSPEGDVLIQAAKKKLLIRVNLFKKVKL